MSKVNHGRGFKANRFWLGQRKGPRYDVFMNRHKTMDGKVISATSSAAGESSKLIRRDRAGAKKFVHSRGRFHDRMACDKIVREGLHDE